MGSLTTLEDGWPENRVIPISSPRSILQGIVSPFRYTVLSSHRPSADFSSRPSDRFFRFSEVEDACGPQRRLISFAASVPYRDKGTIMMGFKDWLTQISGAICHAPTARPREPPPRVYNPLHQPTVSSFPLFLRRFTLFVLSYRVIGTRDSSSYLSARLH